MILPYTDDLDHESDSSIDDDNYESELQHNQIAEFCELIREPGHLDEFVSILEHGGPYNMSSQHVVLDVKGPTVEGLSVTRWMILVGYNNGDCPIMHSDQDELDNEALVVGILLYMIIEEAYRKLSKQVEKGHHFVVRQTTTYIYKVIDAERSFVVDLQHHTCDCVEFQLDQMPCSHVTATIRIAGHNMYNYFKNNYKQISMCITYHKRRFPKLDGQKNDNIVHQLKVQDLGPEDNKYVQDMEVSNITSPRVQPHQLLGPQRLIQPKDNVNPEDVGFVEKLATPGTNEVNEHQNGRNSTRRKTCKLQRDRRRKRLLVPQNSSSSASHGVTRGSVSVPYFDAEKTRVTVRVETIGGTHYLDSAASNLVRYEEMESETLVKTDSDEYFIKSLTSSIDQKLNKLSVDPSYSYAGCIHRVAQKIRKENAAAYTPRLVSIGPLHHDLGQLQGMEAYKLRFLHNFLNRFGIGLHTIVRFAAQEESFVRGCYVGAVKLSRQQLTEMILLDGVFIVELFIENHFFQLRDINEIIFENHWMYNDLLHDMMLLENQLPMSMMKGLLDFVDFSFLYEGMKLTIYDLAQKFFKNVGNTQNVPLTEHCYKARHFVEFLLFLHAPIRPRQRPTSKARKFEYTYSATELQEAGVKFRSREENCLYELQFKEGVLTIPKLTVNDSTETFFRNLVAFEQFGYCGYYSKNIASYVILMDNFINTSHDVDLLVKHGILNNELGESKQVADLFNNLYKEFVTEPNDFYFTKLCGELNDYSRDKVHKLKASWFRWKVMLKRDYFGNPWSLISVIAAVVLLILTVIQTVCSILQVWFQQPLAY
ncbi:hypothetical protein C2S51_026291 [Perilla frutescens var. frutescens]|nr:hypothetical protein C2S51_026291 [Perilla frutescens var. frutescens]